jgi:arylformamidase
MTELSQNPVNALAAAYEAQVLSMGAALDFRHYPYQRLVYGEHPDQYLDLFIPPDFARPIPVLVFLNGGGFTHGGPAWNHFMAPMVHTAGYAFASVGYRRLPQGVEAPMPVEDVAAALGWLARHGDTLGLDAARIVVGGHSAGAALAAGVALRPDLQYGTGMALRGVLCLSGSLHRPAITATDGASYALPPGPLVVVPTAPLAWIDNARVPMLIGWGGRERQRARVERSSMAMVLALTDRGVDVEWMMAEEADHFATHTICADPAHPWHDRVISWLERRL